MCVIGSKPWPNATSIQEPDWAKANQAIKSSAQNVAQWVEILSGLSPGEIVLDGQAKDLREGQKVEFAVRSELTRTNSLLREPSSENPTNNLDWLRIQSLGAWIADLQNPDSKVKSMAELALQDLGTNALPGILKVLNESNDVTITTRQLNFAEAVQYVGAGAKSAVPGFMALLKSGRQERVYSGAAALAFSTPHAPEAFSILTNALTDPCPGVRDAACYGLGCCLSEPSFNFQNIALAETALPLLVRGLKDPVDYVRADTAATLAQFTQRQCQRGRPEPDFLIPPLIDLLQDKYSYARQHAEWALSCSCFTDKLKPWLPSIQKHRRVRTPGSDNQQQTCCGCCSG